MNWKKTFWISTLSSLLIIVFLLAYSIRVTLQQVDARFNVIRKQHDLQIAVSAFNNNQYPKDSVRKIIKSEYWIKRGFNPSDTLHANSIRLIYKNDTIIKIEHLAN